MCFFSLYLVSLIVLFHGFFVVVFVVDDFLGLFVLCDFCCCFVGFLLFFSLAWR